MRSTVVFPCALALLGRAAAHSIHLAYCDFTEGVDSQMIYYDDDGESYSGQEPSNNDWCVVSGNPVPNDWAGTYQCTFGTGVTATSDIQGASNVGDPAGTINNGYETFNCYLDNGRLLFTYNGHGGCSSAYYCLS